MSRFRPFVCLLVGIIFLLQGYAVAAASTIDRPHAFSEAKPPCHMQMAGKTTGHEAPPCCDEKCPNLTTCALGHLAPASPLAWSAPATREDRARRLTARPLMRPPAAPFKPPISLHA